MSSAHKPGLSSAPLRIQIEPQKLNHLPFPRTRTRTPNSFVLYSVIAHVVFDFSPLDTSVGLQHSFVCPFVCSFVCSFVCFM